MSDAFSDRPSPERAPSASDRFSGKPAPPRTSGDVEPEAVEPLGAFGPETGLGSLAQAARAKQLKTARYILIFIGILTLLVNGAQLVLARSMVENEVNVELKKQGGVVANPQALKEAIDQHVVILQLITGAGVAVAVVLLVCAALVKTVPVPATVIGLLVYLATNIGYGILDPTSLISGIIWKIIIVVALWKAVQAAFAYQRELNEQKNLQAEY